MHVQYMQSACACLPLKAVMLLLQVLVLRLQRLAAEGPLKLCRLFKEGRQRAAHFSA